MASLDLVQVVVWVTAVAVAAVDRPGRLAIVGRLMVGSSLNGAMVSSVR